MAVIRFGKIYACSRCPGWQTDEYAIGAIHIARHSTADIAAGVCPVCVTPYEKKVVDGRVTYAEPCHHRLI